MNSLSKPVLILAPHPDDESLGVGSLLTMRAQRGASDIVVFLTDGAGSHVGVPGWSSGRVGRLRAAEARAALAMLGVKSQPVFLNWPDSLPASPDMPLFCDTAARLIALCRRHRIGTILTTWAGEPHCDHEAAAALGKVVAKACNIPRLDYLIWGWTRPDFEAASARRRVLSIDVAAGRPRQRRAISCHRSQRGGRITGGGTCFRLPRAILALGGKPRLILLKDGPGHAA